MTATATRTTGGALVLCALLLAACSSSPKAASTTSTTHHPRVPTTSSTTTSTTAAAPTTTLAGGAPTALAATYTDVPNGQPGYALVVNPGPAGSGQLGGIAVYQYQDGREAGFFSFSGTATSTAPFAVGIEGERAATTATMTVTPASASSITIANCAALFAPAVAQRAANESEPPAPASCTFTYKLAPGPPRTQPTVTTNLVATAAIKSGLLSVYLAENGWQAQYGTDITLTPGGTYLAYNPATGLNWVFASFSYNGAGPGGDDSPSVGMQDGGSMAFFYQIPLAGAPPSPSDGWVMVGIGGAPTCYSQSVVPAAVLSLWNLTDSPACSTPG